MLLFLLLLNIFYDAANVAKTPSAKKGPDVPAPIGKVSSLFLGTILSSCNII